MKFNITVDGGHKAEITVTMDGNGGFAGTVTSPDYGTGAISNGVQTGDDLKGNVSLDGYDADFAAALAGNCITGTLSYGWFFNKSFTGTQAA